MIFDEKKRSRFLGLPLSFTRYRIDEEKVTIQSGFLNEVEDDALMYKIQDVRLTRSLWERIFGLGTVVCYTGDTIFIAVCLVQTKIPHHFPNFSPHIADSWSS